MFCKMRAKSEKGFTLVELLVVIGIIGILAMLLLPQFRQMRDRARVASCQSNLKNIGTSLEAFYADRERYPLDAEWADLVAAGGDLERMGLCPQNSLGYNYAVNQRLVVNSDPAQPNDFQDIAGLDANRPQAFAVTCPFHIGDTDPAAVFPATVQLWVTDQGVGRKDL